MSRPVFARRLVVALVGTFFALVAPAWAVSSETVVQGLNDPRGIAIDDGRLLVVETGTGAITAISKGQNGAVASPFASCFCFSDVASEDRKVYAIAADPDTQELSGRLIRLDRDGNSEVIADIAAYQQTDPDPFDQEEAPTESNPNGIAVLEKGGILVADAAGNDLLRVRKDGSIETVARFPTKELPNPEGGDPVQAEAVPTSVVVGPDGAWYVSELTGFPFTKGASRIWRIKPGTEDHTCDPEATRGPCRVFADGFTSVIDIAFADDTLLVLEIVKEGLLAVEGGGENPPPPIGALWAVDDDSKTELVPGTLLAPGGVAVGRNSLYVTTGTVFGPGAGSVVQIKGALEDDDDHGDHGGRGHGHDKGHRGKKHWRHNHKSWRKGDRGHKSSRHRSKHESRRDRD
jgi:hypothetical protein